MMQNGMAYTLCPLWKIALRASWREVLGCLALKLAFRRFPLDLTVLRCQSQKEGGPRRERKPWRVLGGKRVV
jgi:hypothetical protein